VGSAQASIAVIGGILGCLATIVGIAVAIRNYRSQKAADEAKTEAKKEAKEFKEKSVVIEALQSTVTSQGEVIEGLTRGLKECIIRDNEKAQSIARLQQQEYANTIEVYNLRQRIASLEMRPPT
jgi:hypothetical protein